MSSILFLGTCLFFSCDVLLGTQAGTCQISTRIDTLPEPYAFPYQINKPDETFELDNDLEEVSGLSLTADEKYIVAVQDEDGKVFFLDPKNGKIEREVKFWKDGDYEGIEVVGNQIYVVKSTGTLYRFDVDAEDEPEVRKYNGFLNGDNDVEGLAYDALNQRLLLACKAASGADADGPSKSIYAFRIADGVLEEHPAYCLRKSDVQNFLDLDPALRKMDDIVSFFDPDESDFDFSPSALAIHPITNDIFILSSVGNMLMVIARDGHLKHIEKLSKKKHEQPEGLAFAADGTLYLSNEAGNEDPLIYKYLYRGQ